MYRVVYNFLETLPLTGVSCCLQACGALKDMSRQSPYSCPICGRLTLRPLFDNVHITANVDRELRNVGGLSAYMCTENSHIFFVMKKDVEQESASGRSATGA